jgi:hypothetical protein
MIIEIIGQCCYRNINQRIRRVCMEETVITPVCSVEDKFGEVFSSKDEAESGEIGFVASWTISCVNLARDQVVTGIKKRNS